MNFTNLKNKVKNVANAVWTEFKENPEEACIGIALGAGAAGYILSLVNMIKLDKVAKVTKTNAELIAQSNYMVRQEQYAIDAIIDKLGEADPEWMNNLDADLANLRSNLDVQIDGVYKSIAKLKL